MAQLIHLDGRRMGTLITLTEQTTLGKSAGNTIVLGGRAMMDRHAEVIRKEGKHVIRRAAPGARVTVNGADVEWRELRHGDIVGLGEVTLLFSEDEAPRKPAPPVEEPTSVVESRQKHFPDPASVVEAFRTRTDLQSRIEMLYRVSNLLVTARGVDDLCRSLVTALSETFRPDRIFILLTDETGTLRPRAEFITEPSRQQGRVQASRTIAKEALERREGVLTFATEDPRFQHNQSIVDQRIQSTMCVPIVKAGRALGVIHIDKVMDARRYTSEDLSMLSAVAMQAAIALDNVYSYQAIAKYGEGLRRTAAASQRITALLEPAAITRAAVEEACEIFGCMKGSFLLLDAKGEALVVGYSNCLPRETWGSIRLPGGDGPAWQALRRNEAVLYSETTIIDVRDGEGMKSGSSMVAPIVARAQGMEKQVRPLGALQLADRADRRPLLESDVELLKIFAAQIGVALNNAILFERATVDPLTRVLSRQFLLYMLGEELARGRVAAAFFDLDHFKKVNDEHSHLAGDRVLAAVGEVLRGVAAPAFVGRYGGEELLLILPGADAAAGAEAAERVRRGVEGLEVVPGLRVTISAGVAASSAGETVESLIQRADAALYDAKRGGRNRVVAHGQKS